MSTRLVVPELVAHNLSCRGQLSERRLSGVAAGWLNVRRWRQAAPFPSSGRIAEGRQLTNQKLPSIGVAGVLRSIRTE